MILRFLFVLLGCSLSILASAQTLTISSATQTASSGTTWQQSNNVLTVYGNSTINASTIVSWLSSSSLTILGSTNAISVSIDQNIISSAAGNGLTIGNTNSNGTVTFNNTVNLMGALTVYAEKINLGSTVVENSQSAQLIAGGSTGSISLYARDGFETLALGGTTRGKIMTTGGGNIHINADTDNNNSGQLNIDWLTFDGGTGNILIEASSYSWFTGSGVQLPEFYGSGALTFRNVPNGNHIFSSAWIAVFGNFNGLTLGSNSCAEEILLAPCTVCDPSAKNYTGATWQIAGPVNLYGSKVTVDLSIKATLSNAGILFKSKSSITVTASKSITSNNGDITFWANSDGTANATEGDFIGIYNAVVINSANGSTTQSSGGGTITMAGGTTSQTLASGTIVPTDYAYSNRTTNWFSLPPGGINFGANTAVNGQQNSLSIYSGGGDIVIKGKSNSSSAGIQWFSGMPGASQIIHSGNGTILFDGLGTSSNAHGIELNSYSASGGVTPTITSSSSSNTAIKFVGETSATADRAGFQGAATITANSTGGGIEISGKTPSASTYGAVEAGGILTYALTGPITFIGEGSGGLKIGGTWGKGSLPSSSSNITIRSNVFTLNTPTIQTSGTITVEPFGTSFTNAISFPITNLNLPNTITGLTLGKSTNLSDVTIGSATTISGPITIYGGNISINQNLNTAGGGVTGDVFMKATGNINLAAAKTITTAAGDVSLWSDSDNNSTGYVQLLAGAAINSTGGDINLGGGSDLTSDYAIGTTAETCPEAIGIQYISGVHFRQGSSLTSTGGNISVRGQNANTANSAMSFGISLRGVTMNAGTGKIALNGLANGSGSVNAQAVTSWGTLTLSSANTSSDAISITGNALASTGSSSLGVNLVALFEATGLGGGIVINGKSGVASTNASLNIGGDILAVSGPITLSGENFSGVQDNIFIGSTTVIGKKAGTNVTTSSSNVSLEGNKIVTSGSVLVDCSGTFTVQPFGASFASALTFPLTNLTLASTVSGLTIGKTTNTSDVTIGTATTIAGPINVYAGNININQNLISSASGQGILCKATGNILTASGKTVQTNGGNIIYWADSDNNNLGGIRVDDNATIDSRTNTDRTNTTHTTGGGKIIFAGGLDDGGTGAGTSSLMSGLTSSDGIPDGYAVNSGSTATQSGIVLGTSTSGTGHNCAVKIYSGSGDIRLHGLATNNSSSTGNGPTGLLFFEGYTINGGTTGNITLLGNSTLTAGSWAIGMDLAAWRTSTASANGNTTSVNGNINIIGRAGGGTSGNIAMAIDGDGNRHVFTTTGSGTISLDGLATGASQTDMRLTNVDLLSSTGAITLTTRGNSGISVGGYAIGNGLFLGQKTGTLVTSSSSNISLVTNNLSTSSKPLTVNGTGQFVIEPFAASFISGLTLNSTQTLATTLTGLRLGKLNNTANLTIGAATSINGPITLYGGTLALNNTLTTTNTTTGNLSLNGTTLSGSSTLTVANGRTLTMNLSSNTNYAGLISGTSLNFIKDGAGTLTLPTSTALSFAAMTISGGAYTLNANQQLTLTGALTNNGTFTMKDGATFVQATSGTSIDGTGTYTVEKVLASNSSTWSTTSGRFWYMGVPMVNVARSSYGTPGTTTNRVWSYSEATKSYTELSNANDVLSAGTGYVHRRSTDGTLTFSATGANGLYGSDYSVSGLTKTAGYTSGVNLVSNPYMGFLDWNAVYNASTNIDPTFYIRSNNTTGNNINALISYNASTNNATNTSSVSNSSDFRYIAPMQSIWVKVGASGSTGTVNMNRTMLSHQTGNALKSSTVFPTLARVNLVDGDLFDQLLVYMNGDMSNEVDQYDSEKLPVSGTVQLYTMASNKKLVMNGLKNNKKKVSVPLYLELPETKSYTLQLADYVLEDGLILLEDKQDGTMQDFTLLGNYTFYANSGQLSNRFVLHFILPNAELTTQGPSNNWVGPETSYTDGGNVEITNDDRGNIEITVDQAEEQKVEGNVTVTDMNGKEVYKGQLDGITTAVSLNVPAGIYYLTVQSGALFEKKKVFIQE